MTYYPNLKPVLVKNIWEFHLEIQGIVLVNILGRFLMDGGCG